MKGMGFCAVWLYRLASLFLCVQLSAVEIRLHDRLDLLTDQVFLRDIAKIEAAADRVDMLSALAVQGLPDLGERRIEPWQVRRLIAQHLPGVQVKISGSSLLRRSVRHITVEEMHAAAAAEARERLALPADSDDWRITLKRAPLPCSLPKGSQAYRIEAEPISRNSWGELPYRIRIMQNGREVKRTLLVLRLERYREILVAARHIPRKQVLGLQDVIKRRVQVRSSEQAQAPELESVIGTLARSSLAAGQELTYSLLREAPLVESGQMVEAEKQGAGFTLRLKVQALSSGAEGERINVRAPQSKRILRASVLAAGLVRLE